MALNIFTSVAPKCLLNAQFMYSSLPLLFPVLLWAFSYPWSTFVRKWKMENSQNKYFIVLNCMLFWEAWWNPDHSTRDVYHPFVQCLQSSQLSDRSSRHHSSCSQVTLILLNSRPKTQRVMMLAIQVCQRQALVKCSFKWKSEYSAVRYFKRNHINITLSILF